MALDKWARKIAGVWTEVAPITASTGAGDGGRIIATDQTTGTLDPSLMPAGIGADTKSVVFSETIASGALVNLWLSGGVLKARNADASVGASKVADGYVPTGGASGSTGLVYFDGTIAGLTGLTIGDPVYLSKVTPGGVTQTAPTGTGVSVQYVGKALSATEITFEPDSAYVQV